MGPTKTVEYTVHIWQEANQYIAHAMPLDVLSSGSTPEDARKSLDEAIHLFLVTAMDMGTLEDILQESGYEFQDDCWVGPSWIALERRSAVVAM